VGDFGEVVLAALPPDRSNAERLCRRPERFKCQALISEKSILAAMAYVDLNPVRASIATDISSSRYTGVKMRNQQLRRNPGLAQQPLRPLIGTKSFNMPNITESDYIELVDLTGRDWHAGKRGKIDAREPKALTKLGLDNNHWTMRVKGIGSGLACGGRIGRINRQSEGNKPAHAIWHWLCAVFK
jgi:hypothetical protein